jgi:isoquinoline 1-oxidoreductase beta subunit
VEICEAFECGPTLNPAGMRQQVEGCILYGLGAVLREAIQFENGRITNAAFARYPQLIAMGEASGSWAM